MYSLLRFLGIVLTKCWFFLRKINVENIPAEGPAVLVGNHIHLMDVACVIAATHRHVYFMGKKELFENRFLAWVLRSIGTFPIARGEADISGIRTALRILKDGGLLCIFPEGTRNRERKEPLLPLQEGVAMISLRGKAPIVPFWIEGGYAPWKRCSILVGEKMDLSQYEGLRRVDAVTMKKLTGEIREALLRCREATLKA